MEKISQKSANILSQSHPVLTKNPIIQKHNWFSKAIRLIFLALALFGLAYLEKQLKQVAAIANQAELQMCTEKKYERPPPFKRPVLVRIPPPQFRATRGYAISDPNYYPDLPHDTCKKEGTCPVVTLFTGLNRTAAEKLAQGLFGSEILAEPSKPMDLYTVASNFALGTYTDAPGVDSSYSFADSRLYIIQQRCNKDFALQVYLEIDGFNVTKDVECLKGLHLWREKDVNIESELSNGYSIGKNSERSPNKYFAGYDFLNTDERTFNVNVFCDETIKDDSTHPLRIINMASNAYLRYYRGSDTQILLDFVKDM